MENKPSPADYLIKQKGEDGKYKIVGRGWKNQNKFGSYISISIGEKGNYQNFMVVDVPKAEPRNLGEIISEEDFGL